MHHPGPPRFAAVGDDVELAPRSPDTDASEDYSWSVVEAPEGSEAALGDAAVEHLVPDEPGVYGVELDAPDGQHRLTVRAFAGERHPVRFEVDADEVAHEDADDVWVSSSFNEHVLGTIRASRDGDAFVYETELPPGEYKAIFVPDDNYEDAAFERRRVDGSDRPRISLDAAVEDGEVRFEATPLPGPTNDETAADLDVEFYVDDRDRASFEGDLAVDGTVATCDLDAVGDQLRVHAVAVGKRHSVADTAAVDADGAVDLPNDAPEWIRDATLYSIFTRSFTGEVDASFEAIEQRVPYLEWLGVDALWMTPIVEAYSPTVYTDGWEWGGPHGYDTLDYFDTASDLGTVEEFESLVETCHDHGVKVIFDLVINHTSRHHPASQFADAGMAEYREWYGFEDGEPAHYFNWRSIPNLNYDSLAVREHLLDVVDFWAEKVDGFRCDVAWGVPHGFWKEVRSRTKAGDEDFFLLDESIPRDPDAHELEFDVHYDTPLYHAFRDIGNGDEPASHLLDAMREDARQGFPPHAVQMRYVENHDEDRYVDECGRAAHEAAVAATFALPGMPMVYYGQETGMTHFREDMDWGGDEELTALHRDLIATRDDSELLRRGDLVDVEWSAPGDRAVAFAREHEGERVVVALNFGDEPVDVTLGEHVDDTDLVTGDAVPTDQENGETTVTVESFALLESEQ
ncbi:Glycosidase [Natronoarchaeum philippinense]|uniref:Glycosidase n=1 Tax=Natronoarchaeum philippinense TaxID=558529 RepID=A0A285NTC8_NATPI|nr:alpha-amylase family glycosyl hydrolase [Natronoarchaeum philippinense]SNZ12752.1 Glycosidase [Natronoarchaeum philippinense]